MKTTRILPPRIFQAALLTLLLIHFLLPVFFLYDSPVRWIGLFPILAGIYLNLKSDALIKKHETTIKPFEKPSSLIEKGPFLLSRNPIYLGMVLIVFGGAVLSGSILGFLVPPVLGIVLHYIYILPEEQMLQKCFQSEYLRYRKVVRRWI